MTQKKNIIYLQQTLEGSRIGHLKVPLKKGGVHEPLNIELPSNLKNGGGIHNYATILAQGECHQSHHRES